MQRNESCNLAGCKNFKTCEISQAANFRNLRNFASFEFSQPAKFHRLQNFSSYEISQVAKLQPADTVHPVHCSSSSLLSCISSPSFFVTFFLFLPILILVIAFVLVCFVISLTLSTYISLSLYKLCINQLQSKK